MQSFSRGWSFLKQAWSMALQDKDLIKPSIHALIVGSILSVTGAIPMIVVAILLRGAGRSGQFLLAVMGAVLGFGIGYGIIAILGIGALGLIFGIGLGILIFFTFRMVASAISRYTTTVYHTRLYLWAREVEKAQTAGQSLQVAAPAPFAAVLS